MLNAAVGSPGGGTFDNNLSAWKSMMDINLCARLVPVPASDMTLTHRAVLGSAGLG